MSLIKKRKAKVSKRGLYIQDLELLQTSFKPGTNYTYKVDLNTKTVYIYPSNEGNTVSKRRYNDCIKSVIDIRNKNALQAFEGADFLEVEIFKDYIKVVGLRKKKDNVISLNDYRKTFDVYLSRNVIQSAAGEQLSLFDFVEQKSFFRKSFGFIDEVITAASLFSGAGVMDLGFQEYFNIVFALEKDSDAVKTYRHNFGDYIHEVDIRDFDKDKVPDADLIFGGPPCQGFSNANRVANFLDNPNNLLVREFIEVVNRNKKCKVFVLENVPQILTAGDGQFLREIEESLSSFEVTSFVLNSADFGTPQSRNRAFIIGSKIGKFVIPKPINVKSMNVGQAFLGLDNETPNQLDYSKAKESTLERFRHVPPGGNIFNIPEEIRPRGSHSIAYRRLRLDEVAPTIVNPRKSNILHPIYDRILSVRECARLFDVPDTFEFKGKLSSMQQQIANAVPVKLARAVAKSVKDLFMKEASFV